MAALFLSSQSVARSRVISAGLARCSPPRVVLVGSAAAQAAGPICDAAFSSIESISFNNHLRRPSLADAAHLRLTARRGATS
jgi:hypothetical protein